VYLPVSVDYCLAGCLKTTDFLGVDANRMFVGAAVRHREGIRKFCNLSGAGIEFPPACSMQTP